MGSVNSISSRMLRPLNDDGTLVDNPNTSTTTKDNDEYDYIHEYDYDSGDDADISTFGALIGYEGRKHIRMFKRSIERIKGEVRSKEEANEVAKQLIRDRYHHHHYYYYYYYYYYCYYLVKQKLID